MTNNGHSIAADAGVTAQHPGFSLDFAEMWAAVYRSRFVVSAIMIGCLLVGIAFTLLATPIFRSVATIQIDQEAAKVLGTEQTDLSASIQDAERFLQTQIDILESRSVAVSVARDLRLFSDDGFLIAMDVDPNIAAESPLPPEDAKRELVLKTLADNLTVSLPRVSRLATVSFDSPNAELSARVANGFAENFIRDNLQRKFDASSYAREFLADQLKQAQDRLERSERAAVNFARTTGIIDAGQGASKDDRDSSQSLTTATLVQLNRSYADALAKRSAAEQKWQAARSVPLMSLPEVSENSAIQDLAVVRADLKAKYEEELQRRTVDHPVVRQMAARIQEVELQQANLARSIRDGIRSNREVAVAQERAIKAEVDRYKGSTLTEQSQAVQLSILRREASTNRLQYEALLRRYNELNAEAGVQSNNVSIVDKATQPSEPTWPKLPLNLALALFMGAALSGAAVLGREQIFAKVRTPEDVKTRLGLPLLGVIPSIDPDGDLLATLSDPKSEVSEAYNSVRTALTLSSGHGLPRSLTFVSAQASEGKSSACLATAIGVSKLKKKCVIVDLDLRRPNQHNLLYLPNDKGMSNVLAGELPLASAIQQTRFPNLSVVTGGPIPPNPTELLNDEGIRAVISELLTSYDAVFVDSAPVLALADAVLLSTNVEASVFVIEAGRNSPSGVQNAVVRLTETGARIAGVVLSKFDAGSLGYGYHYAYNYRYEKPR
jgi:capsular exopolysaccharide synthesis family protein